MKLSNVSKKKMNSYIFYSVLLAFPVIQFCIFYIGVNFNSILLAFRKYDTASGEYTFAQLENFKNIFRKFATEEVMWTSVKNSLIAFVVNLLFGVSFGLLFSFYIFRKSFGHQFYKIMLFLPSILSAMVLSVMFTYFTEKALPFFLEEYLGKSNVEGLLSTLDSIFPTVLFFSVWVGFGTSVLMYVGAMNNVSESMLESVRIDGAGPAREFFNIVFPMIWPTFVTFIVVSTAGIFTNQVNLYNFFSWQADFKVYTVWILKANFLGMYYLVFFAYFKGISKEYSEAAYIDGAGETRVFLSIIIPIVRNMFFTVMLIKFIEFWNDYQTPLIYTPKYPPISYGLYLFAFSNEQAISWPTIKMTGAMLTMMPILIVFLIFHNKIIGNVTMGGVKE